MNRKMQQRFSKKISIKQKLIGSFILVTLIFGLASFSSFQNMKETNEAYDYLIDRVSEIRSISQEIQYHTEVQLSSYTAYLLYVDSDYIEVMNQANASIDELIVRARELGTLQETQDRLDEIENSNQEFSINANRILSSIYTNRNQAIKDGKEQLLPTSDKLIEQTKSFQKWLTDDILVNKVAETKEKSQAAVTQVLILSSIAALLAISAGIIISRFIANPIVQLGKVVGLVASGDLNVEKINIKSKDEIYELNQSFERMTNNLSEMIGSIANNADQVAASAEQLNASAEQSSRATETISASIQEIASGADVTTRKMDKNSTALQEVLEGVVRISESASVVSELSRQTNAEAEDGGKIVSENLKQMKFIHESVNRSNQVIGTLSERSKEIGEILNVITAIAEQTNLLALNAAIEAARAGEHGKGFAVVADEVRKLAEQSKQSTQNIGNLVTLIQKDTSESVKIMSEVMNNAENGVKVSEQTSAKFNVILESTRNITPQVEEVTATVEEISASIQEVSASANEIASLSQSNTTSSEEVAASAEEQLASMEEITASAQALASMSEELQVLVSRFKL
ncbi:methyl-accepting chemotaxis protein [Bacillus sp. AK128]